jgi:hypothetical protein
MKSTIQLFLMNVAFANFANFSIAEVPVQEGMVYIPNTSNAGGNAALREGAPGYIRIKIDKVHSSTWGANFLNGQQSGVSIGIDQISPEMKKDLFQLADEQARLTFFFNRSKFNRTPNKIHDQEIHCGLIPISSIHEIRLMPLIFAARNPNVDGQSEIKRIMEGAKEVGKAFGISEVGAAITIATVPIDTLVKVFRLEDDRFFLKSPVRSLEVSTSEIDDPKSDKLLRLGSYLIYSEAFSEYFNSRSGRKMHSIDENWRIETGNWGINTSHELTLSNKPLGSNNGAFMIIKIEFTDTIFKPGTISLRANKVPPYLGKGSAYEKAKADHINSLNHLDVNDYSDFNVIEALKKANTSYESLLLNIKNLQYLSSSDLISFTNKTKGEIIGKTLMFISDKSITSFMSNKGFLDEWKKIFQSKLIVDSKKSLEKQESPQRPGTWILKGGEILNSPQ